MLLNDTCYRLSKGREMRPPLGCILTINKAVKLLSILVDMGNSHLYIIGLQVDYRIERIARKILIQEVL